MLRPSRTVPRRSPSTTIIAHWMALLSRTGWLERAGGTRLSFHAQHITMGPAWRLFLHDACS